MGVIPEARMRPKLDINHFIKMCNEKVNGDRRQ
jgi:hypothetical protein